MKTELKAKSTLVTVDEFFFSGFIANEEALASTIEELERFLKNPVEYMKECPWAESQMVLNNFSEQIAQLVEFKQEG